MQTGQKPTTMVLFQEGTLQNSQSFIYVAVSSFLTENGVKTKLEELHYEGICTKSS